MKFLIDMPLSPELAEWLRAQGHDAVHANDLSMHRSPDVELLRVASAEGRVMITADLDFPRLLALSGAWGPGLILLRGGNYSEAESRECLHRVLTSIAPEELPRCIVVVDRQKIRRRWLPV
jgi:predicted nuclease of predicted toxin-antitoxin system